MSVDGTYGRLSAHNARLKELKYKKSERKKNINSTIRLASSTVKSFKKHDSKTVEAIKSRIREKAKSKKQRDFIFSTILFLIGLVLVVYFVQWIINL